MNTIECITKSKEVESPSVCRRLARGVLYMSSLRFGSPLVIKKHGHSVTIEGVKKRAKRAHVPLTGPFSCEACCKISTKWRSCVLFHSVALHIS